MKRLRLAILISGRGTNMAALLAAAQSPDYPAKPVLVLSNRLGAEGLEMAGAAGLSTRCIDHRPFGTDREAFDLEVDQALTGKGIEMIALAGFMRILSPWFVDRWVGRMVNIHPSLLPKYPGLSTHQRAIDAGDHEAGCSVHWVTTGVDQGGVISQARVAIHPGDTADRLAERVLIAEHQLYPRALAMACEAVLHRAEKSPPD